MFKYLKFLLIASAIILVSSQDTLSEAPTTCKLTAAADARITASPCFAKLQNVISCLPPSEQDLWAKANESNKDTTKCFDCSLVKPDLKNVVKKNALGNASRLSDKAKQKRSGVSCFKNLSELDAESQKKITENLEYVVTNQVQEGTCQAALLKDVGNLMIKRKRLFCSPNTDRDAMINSLLTWTVEDFKFNLEEAQSLVDNFLTFFECQYNQATTYANGVTSMLNVVSSSSACINKTNQPSTPSNTNGNNANQPSTPSNTNGNNANQPSTPTNTNANNANQPSTPTNTNANNANQPKRILQQTQVTSVPASSTVDYTSYVTAFSNLSAVFTDDKFKSLVTSVTNSLKDSTQIRCNPASLTQILSSISTEQKIINTNFKSIKNCKNAFTYIIDKGNVSCLGTCEIHPLPLLSLNLLTQKIFPKTTT